MSQTDEIRTLSLAHLAERCGQESERFFQHAASDPRYCYELMRRALNERDQQAWSTIYPQYEPLVISWVLRHPAFSASGEETAYFVNAAYEKLWVAITPAKFNKFPDLRSLLRYLQLCVHSVITDHMRQLTLQTLQIQPEIVETFHIQPDIAATVVDRVQHGTLWGLITERLQDAKERQVMYGSFVLGLKPRELFTRFAPTFQTLDEIYRVKENVLERLRRDPALQQFVAEDA
jgi:hypothetical protein